MISRANALLLPNSYRHAAHVMLHSPCRDDRLLFNYYRPRHAVLVSIIIIDKSYHQSGHACNYNKQLLNEVG